MMTKLSYWERRYLQTKAKEIRSTEAYEKALQPELNGLFRELNGEVSKWVDKYAKNQGIDSDAARKALDGIHTKHWQMTLKQFREKAKAGGYEDELDAEYFRSRVARLQSLEQQLRSYAQSHSQDLTNSMRKALADQYNDTYMRTNYNLQAQRASFSADFARFNDAQLRIAVSQPWGKDGKDFSQRIWKNYQRELPSYLMDAVLRGTIMGYGPQKVTQMMHARFQDVKRNNVHRLVVSEMAHVAEEANVKAYEENEIEQYEYMATLESHTCDICAKLDGQIFKVSERKLGINYPIIHGRCRCTTVPYIKGLPEVGERWSRDPETGKGKLVANVKFNEWQAMVNGDKPMSEITKTPVRAPKIANSTDFKNYLTNDLGYSTVKIHRMDPKLLQSVADGMAQAYAEYPALRGFISEFSSTGKMGVASFEKMSNGVEVRNTLRINPKYWRDYDSVMGRIQQNNASGFSSHKDGPGGLIAHELGHAVDARIDFANRNLNKLKGLDFQDGFEFKTSAGVSGEILDKAIEKFGYEKTRSVSKYANTMPKEFLAEALSDKSKNPVSAYVRQLVKERLQGVKGIGEIAPSKRYVLKPGAVYKSIKPVKSTQPRLAPTLTSSRRYEAYDSLDNPMKAKTSAWHEQITDDQRSAIHAYTGDMYLDINQYLRGTFPKEYLDPGREAMFKDFSADLSQAIKEYPTRGDLVSYRAMTPGEVDWIAEHTEFPDYKSLAINLKAVQEFQEYYGSDSTEIVKFNVPSEARAAYLNGKAGIKDEGELLLDKGTQYTVSRNAKGEIEVTVVE
ncbi:minor capsid protein [Levilactobacillus namurensis]|uniref:minor capsid protein n=1 Tax=Levilactobacillus namurensis TaxID=380393 RepID=UPI001304A845|nr:minor capsid protein [Levilactobacillus namurensis]HJE44457.1 minor capsid protein [Levilactobacillus namurensis]